MEVVCMATSHTILVSMNTLTTRRNVVPERIMMTVARIDDKYGPGVTVQYMD